MSLIRFDFDLISTRCGLADNLQHDLMVNPRSLYFVQTFCDRCEEKLTEGRMMSFFTNETICLKCGRKEEETRAKIRQKEGVDANRRLLEKNK